MSQWHKFIIMEIGKLLKDKDDKQFDVMATMRQLVTLSVSLH